MSSIAIVSLQNILDLASQYLGETSTPAAQNTIRMNFANLGKRAIRGIRNWSWELATGTPINLLANTSAYTLPTNFKDVQSMYNIQVSDGNVTSAQWPYYAPADDSQFAGYLNGGLTDQIFNVSGNQSDGFTLNINPTQSAGITGGILYKYYKLEPDFTQVTDTTAIPDPAPLAWYVAAQVLLGYREQSQYELAMENYNDEISDLSMSDQKAGRNILTNIKTLRNATGKTNNFRYYY